MICFVAKHIDIRVVSDLSRNIAHTQTSRMNASFSQLSVSLLALPVEALTIPTTGCELRRNVCA